MNSDLSLDEQCSLPKVTATVFADFASASQGIPIAGGHGCLPSSCVGMRQREGEKKVELTRGACP